MPRELADGLWAIDHEFELPGGVELGARTIIVRLADDGLLLHSPGPLDDAQRAAIRELGVVRVLVAPNALHHLYIEDAATAFPEALRFAAKGVAAKHPSLDFGELDGDTPAPAWEGVLDQIFVPSSVRLQETVFFHRASRTLLLTDLCFHVRSARRARTRWLLTAMGTWNRFACSRLLRSMLGDPAAVRAAVDRILEWDFDRVSVAHGEVLETGGREALREAFAWLK